jgi:hypothetical protein
VGGFIKKLGQIALPLALAPLGPAGVVAGSAIAGGLSNAVSGENPLSGAANGAMNVGIDQLAASGMSGMTSAATPPAQKGPFLDYGSNPGGIPQFAQPSLLEILQSRQKGPGRMPTGTGPGY